MIAYVVFLIAGFVLVLAGANFVTDGAVAIAQRLKVSALVIGVTVVAFGSSAPDLVVSLTSTLRHKSELAIGDVVGANIFDILLAVGAVALIRPMKLSPAMVKGDLPLLVLSGMVLFFCGCDTLIDGARANVIDRSDGLMLLCFFVIFMVYTLHTARQGTPPPPSDKPPMAMWRSWVYVVGGLAALAIGGDWIVDGASGLAHKLGLSEGLIGLTIVAFGNAAPDLATSITAAIKGQNGIALGNLAGACILNIFFILGLCATISPLHAGTVTAVDFGVLVGSAALLWLFARVITRGVITRTEGGILTLAYIGYLILCASEF